MSQKIPFLQMFAALRRWTELSNAVEGWLIVSASIDKASRSASIVVEGARGAGANLLRETEDTVCHAYGLNSVKIEVTKEEEPVAPPVTEPSAPAATPEPEKREEQEPQIVTKTSMQTTRQLEEGFGVVDTAYISAMDIVFRKYKYDPKKPGVAAINKLWAEIDETAGGRNDFEDDYLEQKWADIPDFDE